MKPVREIIDRQIIENLWGAGYTILPRLRDPFELPVHLIPRGMSYQWNVTPDQPGWRPVPYSRHDGYFGPAGTMGDIEVGGLHLCERSLADVQEDHRAVHTRAEKNITDWYEKQCGIFDGYVSVNGEVTDIEKSKDDLTCHNPT